MLFLNKKKVNLYKNNLSHHNKKKPLLVYNFLKNINSLILFKKGCLSKTRARVFDAQKLLSQLIFNLKHL